MRASYRRRTFGRTYLLTGLLECGACGKPLLGDAHPNKAGQEPKRRYSCHKSDNYGRYIGCGKVSRLAEPIEILVTEAVIYRLESEDLAALLAPKAPDIAPLLERYQLLQQRSQDLVQDYASGLLNRQQLAISPERFVARQKITWLHIVRDARQVIPHKNGPTLMQLVRLRWIELRTVNRAFKMRDVAAHCASTAAST